MTGDSTEPLHHSRMMELARELKRRQMAHRTNRSRNRRWIIPALASVVVRETPIRSRRVRDERVRSDHAGNPQRWEESGYPGGVPVGSGLDVSIRSASDPQQRQPDGQRTRLHGDTGGQWAKRASDFRQRIRTIQNENAKLCRRETSCPQERARHNARVAMLTASIDSHTIAGADDVV